MAFALGISHHANMWYVWYMFELAPELEKLG